MDHRDWPLWFRAADVEYAKQQKRTAEAAAYPHMTEDGQRSFMQGLLDRIHAQPKTQEDPEDPEGAQQIPMASPEQEAEWAKNREELAAMYGRVK